MNSSALPCWIVVNGYLQQEKFSDLALFVQESAEKKGISASIIRNFDLISVIEAGITQVNRELRNTFLTLFCS